MDAGELVVTIRADASKLESAVNGAKKELEALENRSGGAKLTSTMVKCAQAAEGFRKGIRNAKSELDSRAIQSSLTAIADKAEKMKSELEAAVSAGAFGGIISESERAGGAVEVLADNAEQLAKNIERAKDEGSGGGFQPLFDSVSAAGVQVGALRQSLIGLIGSIASIPDASVSIDTSRARSSLSALINVYNSVASVLGLGKVSGGGGGGGGGGSKYQKDITALEHLKKLEQVSSEQELARLLELQQKYTNRRGKSTLKEADQRDLEERLFEVREKIREEAFNADMDEYEHRKRMGEMSVEQEIEWLITAIPRSWQRQRAARSTTTVMAAARQSQCLQGLLKRAGSMPTKATRT